MSYDTDVLPVVDPQEGYDALAQQYASYHKHLDSFDTRNIWQRYLPRSLQGAVILNLGAGDGRMYHHLVASGYARYIACDISPLLLAQHPGDDVEKQVCDIEQGIPLEEESVDLILVFFVIEHIASLQDLFEEIARILIPGGRCIITYFPQRREFVHQPGKQKSFKITTYRHRYEDIEAAAQHAFLQIHHTPVLDGRHEVGRYYCLVKK